MCPEYTVPVGGVRKLYDFVDILNKHGFPATIVHPTPGFRCTWFRNATPVSHNAEVRLVSADLLVIPEVYGPNLASMAPGVKKVIFNQNCYYTFAHYSFAPEDLTNPYTHPDVRGVMVVSEDSREYLAHAFPTTRIFRYYNAIDQRIFYPQFPKRKQLCFMPRKHGEDAVQVINILKFRGALRDWAIAPIDKMASEQVGEVMRQSQIFLSFGHPEGLGLPPAEAMACGCTVVGYHGQGGKEFFRPEFSYAIPVGDIVTYARTVERVIAQWGSNPAECTVQGQAAAAFVLSAYTREREEASVAAIWRELMGPGR
jgi:glycosyltransferase involved in cell wall biosynthesis